jgi:hypothetical protein
VKLAGRDLKNPAGIIGGNQNNKMQRLALALYGMKRSKWSPTHNIKKLATQRPFYSKPGQASLSEAFDAAMRQQADGIFVLPDEPFFFARRAEIVELATKHRLPAFYGVKMARNHIQK